MLLMVIYDGGSQLGYLIFLVGENQKSCLVNWQSKRIKHVVRSSLSAETLALDDGVYIAEMLIFIILQMDIMLLGYYQRRYVILMILSMFYYLKMTIVVKRKQN